MGESGEGRGRGESGEGRGRGGGFIFFLFLGGLADALIIFDGPLGRAITRQI